ncbi:MAG: rhodanese-like domain-containing protein [Burkholderiaceae bacterium]
MPSTSPLSYSPSEPVGRVTPQQLHDELLQAGEIAVIDVRELGLFTRGHLLAASCVPLWRIELVIDALVPRRSARLIVVDLDESLVAEAAGKLQRLGYSDVAALAGGTLAWQAAGYEIFIDDNVPSKAFGEVVERDARTPHVDVAELRRLQAAGRKLVIVDGRTPEEFQQFSLPGAYNLPNAELPYRIRELAPDPDTLVVVNCAGRTRSIIGAQTLIDAGLPNPVASLRDGTMAWLLAGHELIRGRTTELPEPAAAHLASARAGAQALIRRAGLRTVGDEQLAQWLNDGSRSLYRFDVRSRDEYEAGHLPGWRWAPGGQLVQATDQYIGVRGARVVLADWDGIRAASTAAWLRQLGLHEVHLYRPAAAATLESGPEPRRVLRDPLAPPPAWISTEQLQSLLKSRAVAIFDVENSLSFARRHIAGARFAAPHRLIEFAAPAAAGPRQIVITSSDGILARHAAGELGRHGIPARALLGGNRRWFDAQLPAESGAEHVLTGEDDARYSGYAYTDPALRDAKFKAYLQWEVDLTQQIDRPGAELPFELLPVEHS